MCPGAEPERVLPDSEPERAGQSPALFASPLRSRLHASREPASPAARSQGGAPHAAAMIFTRLPARGGTFRAPARPTFAPGGKSGQKRRSNLRFEDPPAPRALRRAGCDARGWESVETARNVELSCFSERCRFCSEMQGAPFYRLGRLSNRALAAVGGKCRCGLMGRHFTLVEQSAAARNVGAAAIRGSQVIRCTTICSDLGFAWCMAAGFGAPQARRKS